VYTVVEVLVNKTTNQQKVITVSVCVQCDCEIESKVLFSCSKFPFLDRVNLSVF
jgi:hypothetical protein